MSNRFFGEGLTERRPRVKRDGRQPTPSTTYIVQNFSEDEWVTKFTAFLNEQHTSMWGRPFDIHSDEGKRICAEWLAHCASGAQVL
jgi:hypothetical protein